MKRNEKAFNEAYNALNPTQKEAVDSIEGPVMVVAGPGTGKTTLLTLRIAKILKETDVSPENILALTFTNAGVKAMREKLRNYIHDEAYRVGIYTFHSFAEYILTRHELYFPAFKNAKLIEPLEKVEIIEGILKNGSFEKLVSLHDLFSSLPQIAKAIDEIKNEGLTPEEFISRIPIWEEEMMTDDQMFYKRNFREFKVGDQKPTEVKRVEDKVAKAYEIGEVFTQYQAELKKRQRYDFSDMIISLLQGLETDDNLKADLQETYQYLLIDEHQDTNDGQNKLIELLTDSEHLNGRPNIFTVGDEKQSIYRFQGASAQSFAHLQSIYKDVKIIELKDNYRSTEAILTSAYELIAHTDANPLVLTSNKKNKSPITIGKFSDYKFELMYVVDDIKKLLDKGVDPNEIAIIYRSNKHLAEIKLLLQGSDIPFKVFSKDTLLDDPKIKHFINLLRVISDPYNDKYLGSLLFSEFLNYSTLKTAEVLRAYEKSQRENKNSALIEFLRDYDEYNSLLEIIESLKSKEANGNFLEFFKHALTDSHFLSHILKDKDSVIGLRKVDTLYSEVKRQCDNKSDYNLGDFLTFVEAQAKYNLNIEVTTTGQPNGVACMTAHASKGLEFTHVYIVNTTMNNWEKNRGYNQISLPSKAYKGDINDERRLFFVAMTRAKDQLTITSSGMDWQGKLLEPSQFISEIREGMIDELSTTEYESKNISKLDRFLALTSKEVSIFDPDYLAGVFLEERLSVTALNNYLECPIKYLFRNLIKLPDVYTDPQRYGEAMHSALENFFKEAAVNNQIGNKEKLLEALDISMKSRGFSSNSYSRYLEQGLKSLGAYYDYYHDKWLTSVELEEYIRSSLFLKDGTELVLSGKLDKLEFIDGKGSNKVRVVDYKTGKTYKDKTKDQKQALDRQIVFYHLLLSSHQSDRYKVAEAVLDFVEPQSDGVFEQKTFKVEKEDIITVKEEINSMWEAIESGAFLNQGCAKKDCEYCTFLASLKTESFEV